MTRSTGGILIALAVLAVAILVMRTMVDQTDDGGFDLEGTSDTQTDETTGRKTADEVNTPPAADSTRRGDGVPRVLPPDAAIEDVRDALALEDEGRRERAVQDAFDAITRIVQDPGVVEGLERYVLRVEDPVARGVVLAAIGARRDTATLSWLAERLRDGANVEERIGAFVGLTYAAGRSRGVCRSLSGLRVPFGKLPTRRDVLAAVSTFVDEVTPSDVPDVIPALLYAVEQDVDVAALLVVDGARPCKLYAELKGASRGLMRAAALKHEDLPITVRKVLSKYMR